MCFSTDLTLDDEGVCSTTSFPLSLFLGVISYFHDSPCVALVSMDPIAYTSVSWEDGLEYSTICPSFDTSLVAICSDFSFEGGSF